MINSDANEKKKRFWKRAILVSIAAIIVPPLIGCVGTVIAMVKAFQTLGITGENDPSVLSGEVSSALTSTAIGLAVSIFVGLPMLVVSLRKLFQAKKTA